MKAQAPRKTRYTYDYPRPAVTCDTVVFAMRAEDLAVLLVKRGSPPFEGTWALPGGFVNDNEALEKAAARELAEETGLTSVSLEQLGAFGNPGRDPRGHTVSVVYYTFLVGESAPIVAGDDAAEVEWHALRSLPLRSNGPLPLPVPGKRVRNRVLPRLAFDHASMIDHARRRLQERLLTLAGDVALGFETPGAMRFRLVPANFTLTELQRVYEAILGRTLSKRAFRDRLLAQRTVVPVTAARRTQKQRALELYRWRPR